MRRALVAVGLLALGACDTGNDYRDTDVPMRSVATLDLTRYQGLWYEIARFPNSFEADCTAVTAEYSITGPERLSVVNTCRKGSPDGPVEVADGSARVVAAGELKVKFVEWLPFAGDYWILDVTEDYDVAVIGVPSGDFGWILARTPQIDPLQLRAALSVLSANGYDTDLLTYTEQPPPGA